MGVQLFHDRGKPLEPMSALAETEEDEEGTCEPGGEEKNNDSSSLPQEGKDKPVPAANDTDPLAALGDKLAKLR